MAKTKPPAGRVTVAQWKETVRKHEMEGWRYRLVLHDILLGTPKFLGRPVGAVVSEEESKDKRQLTGTIHRPLGADPLVVLTWTVTEMGAPAAGYEVQRWEVFASTEYSVGFPDMRLLQERLKLAYGRYLEEAKS